MFLAACARSARPTTTAAVARLAVRPLVARGAVRAASSLRLEHAFVGRERAAALVVTAWDWEHALTAALGRTTTPQKPPVLPFSLVGSGSTTFGTHTVDLLRAELAKPPRERAMRVPQATLERYANAAHVGISLKEHVSANFLSLKHALWAALLSAAAAGADSPLLRLPSATAPGSVLVDDAPQLVDELIRLSSARDGVQRSNVFIFVDEISDVGKRQLQRAYPQLAEPRFEPTAYDVLLSALHPLLRDARVLMFVAGERECFAHTSLCESPISAPKFRFVPLDPLEAHHLCELIRRSEAIDTVTQRRHRLVDVFQRQLGLRNTAILARRIECYTAGVPRYVEHVLRTLLSFVDSGEFAQALANEEAIDDVLRGPVFRLLPHDHAPLVPLDKLSDKGCAVFRQALLDMLRGATFPANERVGSGVLARDCRVDMLSALGFYFASMPHRARGEPQHPVILRPVLPRYVAMCLWNNRDVRQTLEATGSDVMLALAVSVQTQQHRLFDDDKRVLANTMLLGVLACAGSPPRAQQPTLEFLSNTNLWENFRGDEPAATNEVTFDSQLGIMTWLPFNSAVVGRATDAQFTNAVVRLAREDGGNHLFGLSFKKRHATERLDWKCICDELHRFSAALVRHFGTLSYCGVVVFAALSLLYSSFHLSSRSTRCSCRTTAPQRCWCVRQNCIATFAHVSTPNRICWCCVALIKPPPPYRRYQRAWS